MVRLAISVLVLLVTVVSSAQTVVQRVRIGHSVEDIDVAGKQVVVLDGYEVFAAEKNGFVRVLDVRDAGATSHVNGFTWIDSEKLYAFMQPLFGTMLLADSQGNPRGTRAITYLGGFIPSSTEGITWLPKGTPFPDHLVLVAYDNLNQPRLEIMTRAGTVIQEIVFPPPLDGLFVGSVDVFDATHLLVQVLPNQLYVVDYAGSVVSGPVNVLEAGNAEGVVRTPYGFAVADYFSGKLFALDAALQRRPQDDLQNVFGVKLRPEGIAWNPDTSRYILTAHSGDGFTRPGFSVPYSLDDAIVQFYPLAHNRPRHRGIAYMPDEHRTVVAHRNAPKALLLYNEVGTLVEEIDVSATAGASLLNHVAYVPSTQEFYLRLVESTQRLRVVSRTGTFVRDVDLSGTGAPGFGTMVHAGGNLIIYTGVSLIRTDLDGVLLATYPVAPLRAPQLSGITAITTGPHAGKFAACDSSGAEVIVFSLP
jgi:hypothetical protein